MWTWRKRAVQKAAAPRAIGQGESGTGARTAEEPRHCQARGGCQHRGTRHGDGQCQIGRSGLAQIQARSELHGNSCSHQWSHRATPGGYWQSGEQGANRVSSHREYRSDLRLLQRERVGAVAIHGAGPREEAARSCGHSTGAEPGSAEREGLSAPGLPGLHRFRRGPDLGNDSSTSGISQR